MGTVKEIEAAIMRLPAKDLRRLRMWFAQMDQAKWDDQIARDASSGKLAALAEEAMKDHRAGRTRKY